MARKRFMVEQIIIKLREAEVYLAKRLKSLEQENARLKKRVAGLPRAGTGRTNQRRICSFPKRKLSG